VTLGERTKLWIIISWLVLGVTGFSLPSPQSAHSQDTQGEALKEITETANEICQSPPMEQSSSTIAVQGDLNAKVSKLVSKLLKLGISGAVQYKSNQSRGVLQKDLAEAIKNGNNCRLQVLDALKDKLLRNSPNATDSALGRFSAGEQTILLPCLKKAPKGTVFVASKMWDDTASQCANQVIMLLAAAGFDSRPQPPNTPAIMALGGPGMAFFVRNSDAQPPHAIPIQQCFRAARLDLPEGKFNNVIDWLEQKDVLIAISSWPNPTP
jgi:hypothetical protein